MTGQGNGERPHCPEFDRWMLDPSDPDYLDPAARWCRVCGKLTDHWLHLPRNVDAEALRTAVAAGELTAAAANSAWEEPGRLSPLPTHTHRLARSSKNDETRGKDDADG